MITIGYRVNEMSMSLRDILVVMSRSKRVLWCYEIDDTASNLLAPLFPTGSGSQGSDSNRFRKPEIKEDDDKE